MTDNKMTDKELYDLLNTESVQKLIKYMESRILPITVDENPYMSYYKQGRYSVLYEIKRFIETYNNKKDMKVKTEKFFN